MSSTADEHGRRVAPVDVKRFLAASAGPAVVYDVETLQVLAANQPAATCFGLACEDLTRLGILDLFTDDDAAVLQRWLPTRTTMVQSTGPWHLRDAAGEEFEAMITSRLAEYQGRRSAVAVVEPVPACPAAPDEALQIAAAGTGTVRAALGEVLSTIGAGTGAVLLIGLRDLDDLLAGLGPSGGYELARGVQQRFSARACGHVTAVAVGEGRFCGVYRGLPSDAVTMAEDMVEALGAPLELSGHATLRLSAAVGVRLIEEADPDPQTVLADAYLALAEALDQRRRTVVYSDGIKARRLAHLAGRRAVVDAVADRVFHPHYQPVVDLRTGRTTSFEALLRWPADRLVGLRPDEVVALAEEAGVGTALGELVLTTAIADAGTWQARGLTASVAVNVSAHELSTAPLAAILATACAAAGVSPTHVTLELTESSFISLTDDPVAEHTVAALRELGVRFAIDDFGTGYSSLAYLRSLPADVVKLDRSFIRELLDRPADQVIVESVVRLCHALELQVVAEGVETPAELALLDRLEVDRVQGFLFSPAVPNRRTAELAAFDLPSPTLAVT